MAHGGQKWSVGDAVVVSDPDSREYGRRGTITAVTRNGDLSVRLDGWTYAVFGPLQLSRTVAPKPASEHPADSDSRDT